MSSPRSTCRWVSLVQRGVHILRYSMLTLSDGYSNSYSNVIRISCGRKGIAFDRQLVTIERTYLIPPRVFCLAGCYSLFTNKSRSLSITFLLGSDRDRKGLFARTYLSLKDKTCILYAMFMFWSRPFGRETPDSCRIFANTYNVYKGFIWVYRIHVRLKMYVYTYYSIKVDNHIMYYILLMDEILHHLGWLKPYK